MPSIFDAHAIYKGTQPVELVHAGDHRVWPEVPPATWQPVGSFGAFDWFHADASRVPHFMPPIQNDPGCTCVFDRNADTMTITIPAPFQASLLGMSIIVEWPIDFMPHPDPRNPSGYKLVLDCQWTVSSQALKDVLHTCWSYWSNDSAGTNEHWGEWEMRGIYPTRMLDPDNYDTPPAGQWNMVLMSFLFGGTIPAGTVQLKSPRVTWYQLLPVTE